MKRFKLELDELDEVSIVDEPAVEEGIVRLLKRAEARPERKPAGEPNWDLAVAALDYAIAKRDAEAASLNTPEEVWKRIEDKAHDVRLHSPGLSKEQAIQRVLEVEPGLALAYRRAQDAPTAQKRLEAAQKRLQAERLADDLMKKCGVSRLEALQQVYNTRPELYR